MHGLVGGDDDTGGATEQFPPFDPLHDGSEEDAIVNSNASDDDDDDDGYTHASTISAALSDAEQERRGNEDPSTDTRHHDHHDDGEVGKDGQDEEQAHTPMSNVDPVPESDLHRYQQQQQQSSSFQHRDDDASQTTTTASTILSPVTSPPYWALAHTDSLNSRPSALHTFNNHDNTSTESLVPGAITLQDNEADDDEEQGNANGHHNHNGEPQRQRTSEETRTSYGRDRNKACWAKSVEVTNYVIVNGSATNIGAFVVWNIRVQTLSVGFITSFLAYQGGKGREKCGGYREKFFVLFC